MVVVLSLAFRIKPQGVVLRSNFTPVLGRNLHEFHKQEKCFRDVFFTKRFFLMVIYIDFMREKV